MCQEKISKQAFGWLAFLFVMGLSIWHLGFMEFKNDQLQAILMGNETRQKNFAITHGLCSGVGVNNPPFFLWFMGLVTSFSREPLVITGVFLFFNMLALGLALRYYSSCLSRAYALIAFLLLALSGSFVMYAVNIWAQCLLPLLMILFNLALYRFILQSKKDRYFFLLGLLAALAAGLHMSGFFLFPALIVLFILYRRQLSSRAVIITAGVIFLLFLPYLRYLFWEGELKRFFEVAVFKGAISWKVFRQHLRLVSIDFFRTYFRYDFGRVLLAASGRAGFILYSLAWALPVSFIAGYVWYIAWLVQGKCLFNTDKEVLKKFPLAWQISGFLLLTVSLGYLLLRVRTPVHYLLVLFPNQSLMAGFSFFRLWGYRQVKVVFSLAMLSTVILLVSFLLFLSRSGGYPYEYGPGYAGLLGLRRQLRRAVPRGSCPKLSIFCGPRQKCDKEAISWLLTEDISCPASAPEVPMRLAISWDEQTLHYKYLLSKGNQR
jgi:hypothetical protein